MKANGWEKVENYWMGDSTSAKSYAVSKIPHHLIIDKEGTIVFSGHPDEREDILQDILTLKKDGVIEGEGAVTAKTEEKDVPDGYTEMDPE